jgi:hypothetical protein
MPLFDTDRRDDAGDVLAADSTATGSAPEPTDGLAFGNRGCIASVRLA